MVDGKECSSITIQHATHVSAFTTRKLVTNKCVIHSQTVFAFVHSKSIIWGQCGDKGQEGIDFDLDVELEIRYVLQMLTELEQTPGNVVLLFLVGRFKEFACQRNVSLCQNAGTQQMASCSGVHPVLPRQLLVTSGSSIICWARLIKLLSSRAFNVVICNGVLNLLSRVFFYYGVMSV